MIEDPGEGRLRIDLLDVVLGQGHRGRLDDLGREQRLERLRHGQGHEPDAGPTGGPADEQGRPGVVERARRSRAACRTSPCDRGPGARGARRRREVVVELRSRPRARAPSARTAAATARHGGSRRDARSPTGRALRHGRPRRRPAAGRIRRQRAAPPASATVAQPLDPGQDPALAIVEPLLDVEREDVPAAGRPDAERDRDRVVGLVGDRDGDPLHPELLGPGRRPAVEADGGLAGRQPLDLDVAPADPADAETEDLGDRLLGGPAAGEGLRPVADVALFGARSGPASRSATPKRSRDARIRSTLMMSMPSSVVPGGTRPAGIGAPTGRRPVHPYSTVTDLARLRGWSTSVPRATAM